MTPRPTLSWCPSLLAAAAVLVGCAGAPVSTADRATVVSVVAVSDGDTIRVRIGGTTERVRLIGLDAPELTPEECFGPEASARLRTLAHGRSVRIEADPTQGDRDEHGRLLRHVYTDDGRSLAELQIAEGYAREYTYDTAYRHRSQYRAAEATARTHRRGLWSACTAAAGRAPSTAATTGECTIKGNIADNGERIYHVPGQEFYDKTQISPSAGERWFCTPDEAVAAGWRAAQR